MLRSADVVRVTKDEPFLCRYQKARDDLSFRFSLSN